MAKFNSISFFLIIPFLLAPVLSAAGGITPMEIIRTSNTRILNIYQKSPAVNEKILEEIFSVMEEVTDFSIMADRAVEKVCKQSSDELCARLKNEFIKLLKLTATRKLGRYRADRFEYLGEEITAKQAVVKTIAHFKEDSVQLDYVLEKKGGKWAVVNYIADEVDTIQNYQRQFSRIIKKNSVEFLINRLKKKNEQYQKEREEQSRTQ